MNDVSKVDAALAVAAIARWEGLCRGGDVVCDVKEFEYLKKHALRTLVKRGDVDALALLGFVADPGIAVDSFDVVTPEVVVGDSLKFECEIVVDGDVDASVKLMIDYVIGFRGKKGELREKVFKIGQQSLAPGERWRVQKAHTLRVMTTKKLYGGVHTVALQINGKRHKEKEFMLIV